MTMTNHYLRPLTVICLALLSARPLAAADDRVYADKYDGGKLELLEVAGRRGFLVKPTGKVDAARRWVWVAPMYLAGANDAGQVEHAMYVDRILKAGLHVAGVDVGVSCGSPAGAEVYQKFYELVTRERGLNPKARLLGQSNGGLITYGWAFRHPELVERIGCIYPATDFRTWPGLDKVVTFPEPALSYGLSLDELTRRAAEFNPIDNLAPLARAGVKVFHIHGDQDVVVPLAPNSQVFVERYRQLGGDAAVEIIPGLGHGGKEFYNSESLAKFLTE